jgi:hypothetical protein
VGRLVPELFPLSSMRNDAERMVVEALCDRLTDGWLVFPSVRLSGDDRDYEMDVVIAHERDGIAVIEVKGHRPRIVEGRWWAGSQQMQPQPLDQARENSYALRNRIRRFHPSLARIRVEHAVAFPNVASIRGTLPTDVHETQVLTLPDLEDCAEAVDRLVTRRYGQHPLGEVGLAALVQVLRPDCEFHYEAEARARLARARLDTICEQQVRALATLDMNRRVCVTGAAGTGKTRLATTWTRRALLRGERVLLTCFNQPLAAALRSRLGESELLRVGAFHDVALSLAGMPTLDVPDGADREWWDTVEIDHLHAHWDDVTERFDTIVVDEAQDFDPSWLELLTRLLDPAGPQRVLLVADESQEIYVRGFTVPDAGDGWVRCELTENCRNTFQIASLLHRRFNGAAAPVAGPESEDVRWITATGTEALVESVGTALDHLEERDHAADRVLVATFTRSVRDRLREEYAFVPWEDGDPMAVLCETVHRVKGLEYDHVILAAHADDLRDELLYVGASRAVMSLTVIGPSALGRRLGLDGSPALR